MAESSTLFDTPVRHDELSISNLNMQSTAQIMCHNDQRSMLVNNKTGLLEVELVKFTDKKKDSLSPESRADSDTSMICVDVGNAEPTTPLVIDIPSVSDVDMVEASIPNQKHSTPRYVKCITRAMSSTPNQDFNNSKLIRSVSTQTNFTMVAREEEEFDDDIKSYFLEEQKEENVRVLCSSNYKSKFNSNNSSDSPRGRINELFNFETTPVQSKPSAIRKLSLRSKTIICSAFEKTKDRANILTRHKSAEEKQLFSNTYSLMPQHQRTPPSSTKRVICNPFEKDLQERLGQTIFSPDVFDNVVSPSEDSESMRWTIEDISSINPVPLEEHFALPSDEEDPEKESLVQQEIDRYFSETHCVVSPYETSQPLFKNVSKTGFKARAAASTPQKLMNQSPKQLKSANTQTNLTLPETLPEKHEASLRYHFKLYEADDFLNLSGSNLRRKLFFHSEDDPPSPVMYKNCEKDKNPHDVTKVGRHFTPLAKHQEFSSPEISPVITNSVNLKESLTCKRMLDNYFSDHTQDVEDSLFADSREVSAIMINEESVVVTEMTVDSESNSCTSSALPTSQDTGYQTEHSWLPTTDLTPKKHMTRGFLVTASTPTRHH